MILIAIVYWLVNNWRMGNTKHDFKDNGLDKVFGALADPTRRFFIERLKPHRRCPTDTKQTVENKLKWPKDGK